MTPDIKVCPRCAEDVKAAALVCKHCGHEFDEGARSVPRRGSSAPPPGSAEDRQSPNDDVRVSRGLLYTLAAVAAVAIVAGLAYLLSPKVEQNGVAVPRQVVAATPTPDATPTTAYEALAPGHQLDWEPDKAPAAVVRQAGPYVVTITRKVDGDGIAPVVTVTRGTESVTISGNSVSPTYTHHVALVDGGPGRPPMVMLQSFSGGAHCCNGVQVVADSGGVLKAVDLGSWDGDDFPIPTDVSRDGVPDFVFNDNSFLYAFASYAQSSAPPKIINVVDGRAVDVSARPAFRRLFAADVRRSGETCRNGDDGATRNAACASFVASAARIGQIDAAWAIMLRHYAANADEDYPTGCRIAYKGECPDQAKIVYAGYPEALAAFLKRGGYVPRDWTPPESDTPDIGNVFPAPSQP